MPNIIVREYDNTKAGVGQYSNFSVLIAGPAKDGATCFDENGVFETNNQDEFEEKVGLFSPAEYSLHGAVACEPEDAPVQLSEADFNTLKAEETLYLATEKPVGKSVGYLVDDEWVYTHVRSEDAYDEEALYAVITRGNEGVDGAKGISYGNMMAYILIGLGYTVLYKQVEAEADFEDNAFWSPLVDKSNYDFRYITHGLSGSTHGANEAITTLAHFVNNFDKNNADATTGRGDCTALCEIDESDYAGKNQATAIPDIITGLGFEKLSKYAAHFGPYVVYQIDKGKNPWNKFYDSAAADIEPGKFPCAFHYLACAAKMLEQFNEWYSVAGYTRGVCDFTIDHVGCNFGELAVKALQPRFRKSNGNSPKFAVNLVTKVKGNYYLWGNRTAFELGLENTDEGDLRASHFLNIRQLCTTIKKQVYITCRKYTFDPNSDILWANFCNDIRPTLEKMKADQGITDYKFIKVKTNKKALLKAKIRIVPIEAVEDFDISLTLEDSISGIVAGVDEADAE